MRIGRYWDGHGGIYAGVTRGVNYDFHLILAEEDTTRDMTFHNADEWAQAVTADGLRDFWLPSRREAALLYANLKDFFDDKWYWTRELYPPDVNCAWVQTFGYGRQADARLYDACRARAVRVEPCE